MTIRTRFAPSPTGHLHVGNIRTALHNWMFARQQGGEFLLRLDDTDGERSHEDFVRSIRADLDWLGLHRVREVRQSDRFSLYTAKFEQLKSAGRVYPCFETAQELDIKRKIQLSRGKPPIYDRAALALSDVEQVAFEAEGRTPHWRFRLDHGEPIAWDDLIRGPQHFEPVTLSDPVIRRADGSWLYMLPSVIDDIDMGISHVVRGEDHVTNSALQIQMFEALGAPPPQFAHEALLVGSEGKLSKRLGSLGVAAFRERHIEPQAIIALLARLGTSDPVVATTNIDELVQSFAFAHFGRAPARFDEEELARLNQHIVHLFEYGAVAARLPKGMGADAWEAIRPNLHHMGEVAEWWQVVTGPIVASVFSPEDRDFVRQAHATLTIQPWSSAVWKDWTGTLKADSGRTGKTLFMPLRLALTGRDHGPDMGQLIQLIGRDEALARLAAASAS